MPQSPLPSSRPLNKVLWCPWDFALVWSNGLNISGIFIMALGYPKQPPVVGGRGGGWDRETRTA